MQGFKQLLTAVTTGLAALTLTTSAMAIMSAPYGWYIEGNVGSSSLTNKSYPGSASSSGVGGSGNIGYKFMPYVAVEGDYSRYPNTVVTDPTSGNKAATDKHYSFGLAAKGMFPVSDTGFEIFGKLGAAQVRSTVGLNNATAAQNLNMQSSSHSKIGLYWGGGAAYYFMPELAVNAQWMRAQGSSSTGTLSLLSAGLTLIFG